jgi:hypothetical protein
MTILIKINSKSLFYYLNKRFGTAYSALHSDIKRNWWINRLAQALGLWSHEAIISYFSMTGDTIILAQNGLGIVINFLGQLRKTKYP